MTLGSGLIQDSDIAVVGMACRFPGARNTDAFWQNLRSGVESVDFLSEEELIAKGLPPEKVRDPAYVKARASMAGVEMFDARFFGFSPRDAAIMDPQHRQFLECAYECLENAGHTPRRFRGSIGVFAGSGCNLYLIHHLFSHPEMIDEIGFFQIKHTGNDKDYLATRLSYCLNLTGPSVNVQTACSTSLVAIHSACQSLLGAECDLALAGGVTIDVTLANGYRYQEGEVLSPDGHCHAFDHRARGTIFGNGVGVVALRRLSDAIRDGNTIHAVIKGSAINNDGSSKVGYLAPSVEGQYQAVLQALGVADVPVESIAYVETHGTGTIVGDPIEVRALTQAFQTETDRKQFCGLGSVKTNVGHLDTAAGVASFIKVVESLKHAELPPSLNYEKPNPSIDFPQSPFYVNDRLRSWPRGDHPRRAGVNSLAVGGTNAHVIVEEAPAQEPSGPARPWQLIALSARSEAARDQAAKNLAAHLKATPDENLADVAFTLQVGRTEFDHRSMLVAADVSEAADLLAGTDGKGVLSAKCPDAACEVVFMFTGQGAQHAGMGAELYRTEPAFRATVDQCTQLLKEKLGFDLSELLYGASVSREEVDARLRQTAVTQPALFVVEYSLARLWMEWGVKPRALIGHSIGEYVAACLAGVISLEDALSLVAARGRLMQSTGAGAMLAVKTAEQEIRPLLDRTLSLAAINSPSSCVVSGPSSQIEALESLLRTRDIQCTRLHTSHAFHSALMDEILAPFERQFAGVRLSTPKIPFVSNLTGRWISPDEATSPRYWVRHLRETVRFADGLTALLSQADRVLLEVGPGTTLTTLARQHPLREAARAIAASLPAATESTSDGRVAVSTLGRLWLSGVEVDWDGFHRHERRRRTPLPTYPFEHQYHWIDAIRRQTEQPPAPLATATGRQSSDSWFWTPVWKKTPPVDSSKNLDTSNWVVFGDDDSLTTSVLAQLREIQSDGGGNARMELREAGDFNSLAVTRAPRTEPGPGEVELEVRTAGLNFRDVLIGLGAYPDAESAVMGSECAGVVTRVGKGVNDFKPGDEVLAIAPGFQRFVTVHSNLVARKPKALSFEEAATIPVSFMTAHYALCEVGKLTRGERVLIQAASGGVGLAAVAIAQSLGAEVFATAGSAEKRTFLQSLGIRHVFDSRSTDFADKLLAATGGEGVDVVLNSLAGEFIVRGLEVLRPLGRFLEIGKSDIYGNSQLALLPFRKNISFCSIDLEIVREQRPDFYRNRLRELVGRFADGTFRPLPLRVFPFRKAGQAFQYMAKAKHIGKIVLSHESPLSSITRVATGRGFKRISDSHFEIDPTSAEDYKALFGKLATSGREPDRLVYLWSASPGGNGGLHGTVLADAENRCFYGLLSLAQAFAESGISAPVKLAVVTRGAHRLLERGAVNPLAALTLGPVNVIPRELENVSTLAIDLAEREERDRHAEAATITAEFGNDEPARVIAYRDGDRFVRTFEQTHLEDRQPLPLREKGVYLITGGFGGIGLVFARHLAQAHKARLVLVGRTPIPPRQQWDETLQHGANERVIGAIRAITELESQGSEVMSACADVAEPAQLRAVISDAYSRFGVIHGVIHAAGHIEDAPLQMKTKESAARVLRSKVAGTLNLHREVSNAPLDFFAVFSSVSAIDSPAGQIDYAAANSFLDSFARVDSGSRVIAIDWAAWRDVGMAVRALEKHASKRPMGNLPQSRQVHPLIEGSSTNGDSKVFWTVPLGTKHWLLDEHRVADGSALLPGTGYLELIRGALAQEVDNGELALGDVRFLAPFVVGQGDERRLKIAIRKEASDWDLVVTSTSNGKADEGGEDVEHVRASAPRASKSQAASVSVQELLARCPASAPPQWDGGPSLTFGPRWNNLTELRLGSNEAFARLQLPEPFEKEVNAYKLHPALVDIAVACGFPLAPGFTPEADSYAPLGCERLVTRGPLASRICAHIRRSPEKNKTGHLLTLDIRLFDERGTIVAEIDGFTLKKLSPEQIRGNGSLAAGKQSEDRLQSENSLERAVRSGIGSTQGIEAFLAILKDGRYPQIAVSPVSLTAQAEDRPDSTQSVHEPQAVPSPSDTPAAVTSVEDDVERGVIEVLKKALGVQKLSADDNFFEMGGDSLSAMRVVTQLKNRFSTTLPIGTLFENPTAATLTAFMKEQVEKSR